MEHGDRQARVREFYDVVTGLWYSWADDAFVRDAGSGCFFDPERLHVLDHRGPHPSVRGPLHVARPVQGWPVIVQAGASEPGRQLGAETAEVVFAAPGTLANAHRFDADVKGSRERVIELARSEKLAVRQLAQRLGGCAGLAFVGTPQTIAGEMQHWLESEGCGGFNIMFPWLPGGLLDFVDQVVHALQRRGIFRKAYEGTTLREHLGLPRPANRFFTG